MNKVLVILLIMISNSIFGQDIELKKVISNIYTHVSQNHIINL